MRIKISKENLGNPYYGRIQMYMPKDSEYASYCSYIKTEDVIDENGEVFIDLNDNEKVTFKFKNKRVSFLPNELQKVLNGEHVEKKGYDIRKQNKKNEMRLRNLTKNIPTELQEQPNWVVFKKKWNEKKKKMDKVLISPVTNKFANSIDSATWTTIDNAINYAVKYGYEGIAFALENQKGITCIDLDQSIDDAGNITQLAQEFMDKFISMTYIETSVSKHGIHIFVKDDVLENGKYRNRVLKENGEIEIYDNARFISMTGNHRTSIKTIESVGDENVSWLRKKMGLKPELKTTQATHNWTKTDRDIIDRIRQSRKGKDFDALYNGISQTGDHSRDDFKLLNILAFFTDSNAEQMERIFRQSGLYRKEKGDKYIELSIRKAIASLYNRIDSSPKPKQLKMDVFYRE